MRRGGWCVCHCPEGGVRWGTPLCSNARCCCAKAAVLAQAPTARLGGQVRLMRLFIVQDDHVLGLEPVPRSTDASPLPLP